jgi:hypothetical protein
MATLTTLECKLAELLGLAMAALDKRLAKARDETSSRANGQGRYRSALNRGVRWNVALR